MPLWKYLAPRFDMRKIVGGREVTPSLTQWNFAIRSFPVSSWYLTASANLYPPTKGAPKVTVSMAPLSVNFGSVEA